MLAQIFRLSPGPSPDDTHYALVAQTIRTEEPYDVVARQVSIMAAAFWPLPFSDPHLCSICLVTVAGAQRLTEVSEDELIAR